MSDLASSDSCDVNISCEPPSDLYQLGTERLRANVAAVQTHLKLLLALGDLTLLGLLEGANRLDDLVFPMFDYVQRVNGRRKHRRGTKPTSRMTSRVEMTPHSHVLIAWSSASRKGARSSAKNTLKGFAMLLIAA
jgi:hypothetical protein